MGRRTVGRMLGLVAMIALAVACTADGQADDGPVILATTTSTHDSGLLDDLVPLFEEETGFRLDVIAVGSGQAIELGRRGEADVVLAHSPEAERELVATGVTGDRALVMYNGFVVLGPVDDPAQVGAATSITEVMQRIATGEAEFISRGDDSGTHALELALWERAGIEPSGSWYREAGQGMGATLQVAAEAEAYTLSDRGTWLATQLQEGLAVVYEDDPALFNHYHVMPVTDAAGERVREDGGQAFAEWIVEDEVQERIGAFGIDLYGQPLFVPAADRDADELRGG